MFFGVVPLFMLNMKILINILSESFEIEIWVQNFALSLVPYVSWHKLWRDLSPYCSKRMILNNNNLITSTNHNNDIRKESKSV